MCKNNSDFSVSQNLKRELITAVTNFEVNGNNVCNEVNNKRLHETLMKLSKNKDINICSFDKGNGIVFINTDDYCSKMKAILSDESKFKNFQLRIISKNIQLPWMKDD